MLIASTTLILLALAGHAASENKRYFAYMDARNEDGSKKRTHVYALTTAGTLAARFTSKIDEWRREVPDGLEPLRYNKTLALPSPEERNKRVLHLYAAIDEFNTLSHKFFERQGKKVPQDHLLIMRQNFGPGYEDSNQYLPTGEELNSLHEQFALLLGPGAGDPTSPVWGNWTEHLHHEMVQYLGHSPEDVQALGIDVFNAHDVDSSLWQHPDAIVLRMYDLLEHVNTRIHATENMNPWSVHHRFTFNTMKLGNALKHELFVEEDYEPDRWRMAMEMGGLYMAYAKTGKNLYALMIDNDINSLKNHAKLNTIQFQEGFYPELYAVWSLGNETEAEKRRDFQQFWDEHNVSSYGFQWGNRSEPNGFIRLGQQVCDPPSDCDRQWIDLLEEFGETPIVDDIRFSQERPYGEMDEDLRFLYPGDDVVISERYARWWPLSLVCTPAPIAWRVILDDWKAWWYTKVSLPWPLTSSVISAKSDL